MYCYELFESLLPDTAHLTREFDIRQIGNRRFMFNPRGGQFLLGDARGTGRGKAIRSSHAEEYYDVHQTNAGFDHWVRGWVGAGGQYRFGIIHFAPPIVDSTFDAGWKCLEAFLKHGATGQTVVRGFPGAWEQKLGAVLNQ